MKTNRIWDNDSDLNQLFLNFINSLHNEAPFKVGSVGKLEQRDPRIKVLAHILENLQSRYEWDEFNDWKDSKAKNNAFSANHQQLKDQLDARIDGKSMQDKSIQMFILFCAAVSTSSQQQHNGRVLQHPKVKGILIKLPHEIRNTIHQVSKGVPSIRDSSAPRVLLQLGRYMKDFLHEEKPSPAECERFDTPYTEYAVALGRELARSEWSIVFGGRIFAPSFDVCKSFCEALGTTRTDRVTTYSSKEEYKEYTDEQRNCMGTILYTQYEKQWHRRLDMVGASDIMLSTGGTERTGELMLFADLIRKPIVPLVQFGGEASNFYRRLMLTTDFSNNRDLLICFREEVGQVHSDMNRLAALTVNWLKMMYEHRKEQRWLTKCPECSHQIDLNSILFPG